MTRNLKVLGVALVATLVMSASGISAAQATPQFTCSSYPCSYTGSVPKGAEVLTTEAGKVECASHYLSHPLSGPSSTLTLTPTFSGCTAFGLNATVTNEGCVYELHATEKVSTGIYKHHVDKICPSGKAIKISAGGGLCQASIGSQTGLTTVKTTNSGGGIFFTWEISGIAYTVTTDGFGCPFSGTGAKTGGTFTGQVTMSRVGGGTIEVSGS